MQRAGIVGSLVPSRECERPREPAGETSSTRTSDGDTSPCAPVGVRFRSFIPNGRGRLNPSLEEPLLLFPFMMMVVAFVFGN